MRVGSARTGTGVIRMGRGWAPEGDHRRRVLGAVTVALLLALPLRAAADLPNPTPNIESLPAGSLVVAMDNDKQNVGATFNLKAYGLTVRLLKAQIPVKWVIRAGKAKDGIDFSVQATRVAPTAQGASNRDFRGGPFAVEAAFASQALAVISDYGNNVAVFQTTAAVNVDVRFTLTQRPVVAVANDEGTNAWIHTDMLAEAGFVSTGDPATTDYFVLAKPTTSAQLNANLCTTILTEPHYEGGSGENSVVAAVRTFAESGGNVLAQCEGLTVYENNVNGRFQTTLGVERPSNTTSGFTHPAPDLAFSQFVGSLSNEGGSIPRYVRKSGSVFQNGGHVHAQHSGTFNPARMKASAAQLGGGVGGNVFYLAGHNYEGSSLSQINGRRMYLNAVFVPADRPASCGFDIVADLGITKGDAPDPVTVGAPLTYTLTVTNHGPGNATGVTVTDTLPGTASFSSAVATQGTCSHSSGTVTCAVGAMQASDVVTITIVVTPTAPGTISNTAAVSAATDDDDDTNDSATQTTLVVPLPTTTPTVTKTAVPPTSTKTAVPTNTNTAVPTSTNTPLPTSTNTAVPTSTMTPVPTDTATALPTETATALPTETATALPTETATALPTETATALPTETATALPTETATALPTETATALPTETATALPTETATALPTETATALPTETATALPTETATALPTETATALPTETATALPTETATALPTETATALPTETPTSTAVPATATPTRTPTPGPVCGDGVIEGGEACDDGNLISGDGCEANCAITAPSACQYAHGGSEHFVGGCGAPAYADIQAAIDAAADGDVVSVCPGTYTAPVAVTKQIRLRAAAPGVTLHTAGTAIDIQRSGVRIEGLTIRSDGGAAIAANAICPLAPAPCTPPGRGSNLTIAGNTIVDSPLGITWERRIDCALISGNTMTDNAGHIRLAQQEGAPAVAVRLLQNTITGGGSSGASVALSGFGPLVAGNTVAQSATAGITVGAVPGPGRVVITDNAIRDNLADGVTIGVGAHTTLVQQNNITGNGVGLGNEAPGGVVDATLNWWGSQSGPFHAVERTFGLGDRVEERAGGLDTAFIEYLCGPAPGGFPSENGTCALLDPQDLQMIAPGRSPDVSPNGRFVTFVSSVDLNGDQVVGIDNADGSDEVFVLNRKPSGKPASFCLGGSNPGSACQRHRDCPADGDHDPIILEGVCALITQLTHDPSGNGTADTPRATQKGDIVFTATADLTGANADGSKEVVRSVRRSFRRQLPSNPNTVLGAVSNGPAGVDSEHNSPARNARVIVMASSADPLGTNADGNSEIFAFDTKKNAWAQITHTLAPVQNRRPSTHTGKQVLFDSDGDFVSGENSDGNREIFLALARGTTWVITQVTATSAPAENRAGAVAKRGKVLTFSSDADLTGGNGDGSREIFIADRGVFTQITNAGPDAESANPVLNPRGRFVVFESTAELVPEEIGLGAINRRVFLYDRVRQRMLRLSRTLFGDSFVPRISNGRFIVWESTSNLTGQNPTGERAIYLFDRRRDD